MTLKEMYENRKSEMSKIPYSMKRWDTYNFKTLDKIICRYRRGKRSDQSYNDCIIMADTETSKKTKAEIASNHVVAWTISIRAFNLNIVTLWGQDPREMVLCIEEIKCHMKGQFTYIYFHNLAYDWVFLRKFFFEVWGTPERQLNTKSHYPIMIEMKNGIVFKDSLILAQRSLEKWAEDMCVEHQKSVGKWDYDKIRSQREILTDDELEYIEHDTLAGVECLQKLMDNLGKDIASMPYTATGIPREEVKKKGQANRGCDLFKKIVPKWEQQQKLEMVYHGGFTHANRHMVDMTIDDDTVECYDFASSYPFVMLSEKFPMSPFKPYRNCSISDIIRMSGKYAFMMKLVMVKPIIKDDYIDMPALQYSKCTKVINPILDNGRILRADYVEIYVTEQDLLVLDGQYTYEKHICTEVEYSKKDYLPKWFTDYIFELFTLKTQLKNGDPVLYALAKAKLNSLYGMCVQKPVKQVIEEDYMSGEYHTVLEEESEIYQKYVSKKGNVLPYHWGVWVTAYAFRNLFLLGECAGTWIYSDTDSCYGQKWDKQKLDKYNALCKQKLVDAGYGCVEYNGREYWLGVAEFDGAYSEYRVLGAKRYCGRKVSDGKLKITVAGVPKKNGVKCLNDDINNFTRGLIFSGEVTGKKTHSYIYVDEIYTDSHGNLTGDSIDLNPCDYLLDTIDVYDWDTVITDYDSIQVYEGSEL